MVKLGRIKRRCWALTMLLALGLAYVIWTGNPVERRVKGEAGRVPAAMHDLQSIYSDYMDGETDRLIRLNYHIISNSSENGDDETGMNVGWTVHRQWIRNKTSGTPRFRWCYENETMDEELAEGMPCDLLFEGRNGNNSRLYWKAKEEARRWRSPCEYSDERVANLASTDCAFFRQSFNFVEEGRGVPVAREEKQFPLAYVLVMHKWAAQAVRVLSAFYRPHNIYCITYDQHSTQAFKRAMNAIAVCLPNILIPDKHLEIAWADISVLMATLNCMRLLHNNGHQWKYLQILSYNDFPLRTNLEVVRILREFQGANDVELTTAQTERFAHFYKLAKLDREQSKRARPIPPAGLVLYKGSFAATLSRQFVQFVFQNSEAKRFLNWSLTTWAPEEQFWATLVHNEHLNAPGHYPGYCLTYYNYGHLQKLWISRYQIWYRGCYGRYKSGSCIFGVGDLPVLVNRPELVAHKFYADFEPATFYCLARRHYERTFVPVEDWEYPKSPLDINYYSNLPAVQYERMKDKENFNCAIKFKKITAPR